MQKKPTPAAQAALATAAIAGGVPLLDGKDKPEPKYKCECGAAMREPLTPNERVLAYCPKCGRLKRPENV